VRLPDDLLASSAYPPVYGATRSIELRETHISWVFLLDDDVFKVKKPVNLGFLDFTTIEKRKRACEAEARLNRRLADGVYGGLVPVRAGKDGRVHLGGEGPIVDWAVQMVRLPDAVRGDTLLGAGALGAVAIDELATRLARFHAGARCDEETARFGAPESIAQNVEENFAQTAGALDQYVTPDEAAEIIRWQTEFLAVNRARLLARVDGRHVRDGHGDLRLEHVYFHGTPDRAQNVTILDCIEFNERFRFADSCADIAFLSMDLAASGRVDLAERFIAKYARESNDFDLYGVVDFYEGYRAFVRGKIAAMRANDASATEDARARAHAEARKYFLMALSADRRSLLAPEVVCVGGVIASGKSTIADRIGAALAAPVIDADRARKFMLGVEPTVHVDDGAWSGAYDPRLTERVYAEILRRADVVLASGRPVVLDASFRSAKMRAAAKKLAHDRSVPFRFVECRARLDVCRERLATREKRGGEVSDGRLAIFDDFIARVEPVTELPKPEHIVVDTERRIDDNVRVLSTALGAWPPGFNA
jgi:aminoglycoside phosphotransferase family enzyme/predicted kinase